MDPLVNNIRAQFGSAAKCTPIGANTFVVTGYEAAETVLKSRAFAPDANAKASPGRWNDLGSRFFIFSTGHDHQRIRRLLTPHLSQRMVTTLEGDIRAKTLNALDAATSVVGHDSVEAVQEWSVAISSEVLANVIGLVDSEAATLRTWASRLPGAGGGEDSGPEVFDDIAAELDEFSLSLMRNRESRTGVLNTLRQATADGTITVREGSAALALLVVAGFETSTNFTSNVLHFLMTSKEVLDALDKDPRLIEPAVEELLRLHSPAHAVARTALEHTEIAGLDVPQGARVMVLLSLCNRDSDVYELADHYKADRTGPPHLSFAAGPHYCIGAGLARQQAAVMLRSLVLHRADLPLALAQAPKWYPRMLGRGIGTLHVRRSTRSAITAQESKA